MDQACSQYKYGKSMNSIPGILYVYTAKESDRLLSVVNARLYVVELTLRQV